MRPRPQAPKRIKRPETQEKLFAQVIDAATPKVLDLWERADKYFPKAGVKCDEEILHEKTVGKSYYQCNPHFWQCYWQNGVSKESSVEVDLFGQKFHITAKASFDPISVLSSSQRFYKLFKRNSPAVNLNYGYIVELAVNEIPGLSQPVVFADTCRDTYLPQRIYGYKKVKDKREEGFIWDNFDRHLFLDKFYVTNRQVNEWRLLSGEDKKLELDRKKWPHPAFLTLAEQEKYCSFYGKRVLEAKLFDAAMMSPTDLKNSTPERIYRPQTPWQRDLSKTFLGLSRVNPDNQLTPLDCQLAQVQGCLATFYSTDSASWMGLHFALGFYPERLQNFIDPDENLKMSSRFHAPSSEWHELGNRTKWNGTQSESLPVAFRCYEEVSP